MGRLSGTCCGIATLQLRSNRVSLMQTPVYWLLYLRSLNGGLRFCRRRIGFRPEHILLPKVEQNTSSPPVILTPVFIGFGLSLTRVRASSFRSRSFGLGLTPIIVRLTLGQRDEKCEANQEDKSAVVPHHELPGKNNLLCLIWTSWSLVGTSSALKWNSFLFSFPVLQ